MMHQPATTVRSTTVGLFASEEENGKETMQHKAMHMEGTQTTPATNENRETQNRQKQESQG